MRNGGHFVEWEMSKQVSKEGEVLQNNNSWYTSSDKLYLFTYSGRDKMAAIL